MPIIAKRAAGNFTPAPEGPQQAVCVDVVDLGLIEESWQEGEPTLKHKIAIVWHSAEIDPETGKPYTIQKRYNLSLHEKATLTKDLTAWRGRAFTDAELEAFDVESVIGANAYVSITHNKNWANVTAIMPLPKGMAKLPITAGYVRRCDRDDYVPPASQQGKAPDAPPFPDDDDEIPF
jgi:hypothetical protein